MHIRSEEKLVYILECKYIFSKINYILHVCTACTQMRNIALTIFFHRQVMERMTSQKLPARKMKVLYKKWIEVEEKIGDEEHVESVRKRALEFINNAKF